MAWASPSASSSTRAVRAFPTTNRSGPASPPSLCRDLKLSSAERERITWLVTHHQYLGEARKLRESKLKRILAEPGIDELLALHRADALATTGITADVDYCENYLRELPTGPIKPPPLVTGHDLVRHGLEPGPAFGKILEKVREAQLDGTIRSKREALEWLDRWIQQGLDGPPPP